MQHIRENLVQKKKEIGLRLSELNTIIADKKSRKEPTNIEIQMKSHYEKELMPIKAELRKQQNSYDEVYIKIVMRSLPTTERIKIDAMVEKALRENTSMNELNKIEFSLYNHEDLQILSTLYPQALKNNSALNKKLNTHKLKARDLMVIFNTRLTPDEQNLVKEFKEFLSNIINT